MPYHYSPLALGHYTSTFKAMPVPRLKSPQDAPTGCFQLSLELVPYLLGLLEEYRWPDKFVGTPDEIAQALNVIEDLRYIFMHPQNCGEMGVTCLDYAPSSPIIEWSPMNPFTQAGFVPDGYKIPPWEVSTNPVLSAILGLEVGDVISGELGLPVTTPAINQGLARFRVKLVGEGTVELHLITIPFGGTAVITVDDNPLSTTFVDLIRNVNLTPPENNVISINEFEIKGQGDHHIDVTMIPSFAQTVTFVGYGGGIRKVNLCGFEPMQGGKPDNRPFSQCAIELEDNVRLRINPANPCEWQQDCGDGVWSHFWSPEDCGKGTINQPSPEGELSPGQCKVYNVTLQGKEKWRLPVPVASGYTVTVTGFAGMWFPNVGAFWYCPNGAHNVLGVCTGSFDTDSGNPLPSAPRARVVYEVNGVFYDAYTPTTIPAGVSLTDLTFQMNDADLSDNQGNVSFNVTVCAPVSGAFVQETLSVPLNSGSSVSTVQDTNSAKVYKVTVDGVGSSNVGINQQDAWYASADSWATHVRATVTGNACDAGDPYIQLYINGAVVASTPAYQSSHIYELNVQGIDAPFAFKFCDSVYTDNTGALSIKVEEL